MVPIQEAVSTRGNIFIDAWILYNKGPQTSPVLPPALEGKWIVISSVISALTKFIIEVTFRVLGFGFTLLIFYLNLPMNLQAHVQGPGSRT